MGRKSHAKAARRAARANEAMAGPDQIVSPHQPPGRTSTPSMQGESREVSPLAAPRLPYVQRVSPAPSVGSTPPARPQLSRPAGCNQLRLLVARQVTAQLAVEEEVRILLRSGCSWTVIGRALGLSRQEHVSAISDSSQPRSLKRIGLRGGDSRDWPCSAATGFAKT